MNLESLKNEETVTRRELETVSAMVQDQHRLPEGHILKLSYCQMTALFDRLDAAREAHDAAYEALDFHLYGKGVV